MGTINRLFLLVVFLLVAEVGFAQKDSVVAKEYNSLFTTEYGLDRNLPYIYEDTVMRRNEIYHPYFKRNFVYQDLGIIGSAGRSLFFTWNRNTDFVLGFNPYQQYYRLKN